MPRSRRATPRTRSLPRAEALALQTVEAELRTLARDVGLLGAATPRDAHVERARLRRDYAEGRERLPLWTYDLTPATHTHRLRRLDALAAPLRAALDTPLGELYRARADELRLELEAALAVATPRFAVCAEARASRRAPSTERPRRSPSPGASSRPRRWTRPASRATTATHARSSRACAPRSRDASCRSPSGRALRCPRSPPSAATPSGSPRGASSVSWTSSGRSSTRIEAHALPRTRARSLPVAVFAIGTAGGSDDQEGYALWLEVQRRPVRARPEARTRRAPRGGGADARRGRLRVGGAGAPGAWIWTSRTPCGSPSAAFRGSNGVAPGLGRERVYLEAFVRVRDHLASRPGRRADALRGTGLLVGPGRAARVGSVRRGQPGVQTFSAAVPAGSPRRHDERARVAGAARRRVGRVAHREAVPARGEVRAEGVDAGARAAALLGAHPPRIPGAGRAEGARERAVDRREAGVPDERRGPLRGRSGRRVGEGAGVLDPDVREERHPGVARADHGIVLVEGRGRVVLRGDRDAVERHRRHPRPHPPAVSPDTAISSRLVRSALA